MKAQIRILWRSLCNLLLLGAAVSVSAQTLCSSEELESPQRALLGDQADLLLSLNRPYEALGYSSFLLETASKPTLTEVHRHLDVLWLQGRQNEWRELVELLLQRYPTQMYGDESIISTYLLLCYSRDATLQADSLYSVLKQRGELTPGMKLSYQIAQCTLRRSTPEQIWGALQSISVDSLSTLSLKNDYYSILTQIARETGHLDSAQWSLEQMIALRPEDFNLRTSLLFLRNQRGDYAWADQYLLDLEAMYDIPEESCLMLRVGLLGERPNMKQRADFLYQYLMSRDTMENQLPYVVSHILPDVDKVQEMPEEFLPALLCLYERFHPEDEVMLSELVQMTRIHQGDWEAEALLKRMEQQSQTAYAALLVRLLGEQSPLDVEERRRLLQQARSRFPDNYRILAVEIEEISRQGESQEALNRIFAVLDLEKLKEPKVAMRSGARELVILAGMLLDELKQWSLLEQWFERGIQLWPKDPILLNNYAYYLYSHYPTEEQKIVRSEQLIERAYSQAPNEPHILNTYGVILTLRSKYTLAQVMLSQAVARAEELGLSKVDYLLDLGHLFELIGDKKQALEHWRKAYTIRPDETLRAKIEVLEQQLKSHPRTTN